MRAAAKKKQRWWWSFRNCTFYLSQGHFWHSDWKNEEEKKSGKSRKRGQVAKPSFDRCHFPNGKRTHSAMGRHRCFYSLKILKMRSKTKKKKSNQRFLRVVRFTQTRDTFLPVRKKGRKGEKDRKSWKRCQMNKKSIMVRNRPQSGTKQSIWRRYKTGLYEMMLVWNQKWCKKTLSIFKNDNKTCMILRILLFRNSGFCDPIEQNSTFCCMICTRFWKKGRSKEPPEVLLQCTKCTLT